jgi:hypothetical protein
MDQRSLIPPAPPRISINNAAQSEISDKLQPVWPGDVTRETPREIGREHFSNNEGLLNA